MSYEKMYGLLSMVFSNTEIENSMGFLIENMQTFPLCNVEQEEIETILKKLRNKITMVKQTIKTLEHTSMTIDLDASDSLETLRELQSILAFVFEKVANAR